MRVEPGGQICGIPAVLVKMLMRKERFTTPKAMQSTGFEEPLITQKLLGLVEIGLIQWDGCHDGIDYWATTEEGDRLAAARLIKRFSVAEGQAIVKHAVERAGALNRDPMRSERIVAMYLFGSVLTGGEDGTAGDVDLVVNTSTRRLSDEQLDLIRQVEFSKHENASWYERLNLASTLLKREVRSVSRKVSLHGASDLEVLGVPHRQVYAFDIKSEREIPFDPSVRQGVRTYVGREASKAGARPPQSFRAWPAPANSWLTIEGDEAQLAQHLWQNGLDAIQISQRVHRSAEDISDYLSTRDRDDGGDLQIFDANLAYTVHAALPETCPYRIHVSVRLGTSVDLQVEAEAVSLDGATDFGRMVWPSRGGTYASASLAALPVLERVGRSCLLWRERMKRRAGRLSLVAHVSVEQGTRPKPSGPTCPDFQQLTAPLKNALHARLENETSKWKRGLVLGLRFGFHRAPQIFEHNRWVRTSPNRAPAAIANPLKRIARDFAASWREQLASSLMEVSIAATTIAEVASGEVAASGG